MASPDKESQFVVVGPDAESDVVIAHYATLEEATEEAGSRARGRPGLTFTVYKAISDFKAGEIPVEQTNYRQAASRKAE